jgi:hypothetical protein
VPCCVAAGNGHPHHTSSHHTSSHTTTQHRAWVALAGKEAAARKVNVCIGSTSARACAKEGLQHVLYPDSPGIEQWVGCVLDGLAQLSVGRKQPVASP